MGGLYKLGVCCVVQNVGYRVLWEDGADSEMEKSWVRAHDLRMCVVSETRLMVRGAAGRRGAGTDLGR